MSYLPVLHASTIAPGRYPIPLGPEAVLVIYNFGEDGILVRLETPDKKYFLFHIFEQGNELFSRPLDDLVDAMCEISYLPGLLARLVDGPPSDIPSPKEVIAFTHLVGTLGYQASLLPYD